MESPLRPGGQDPTRPDAKLTADLFKTLSGDTLLTPSTANDHSSDSVLSSPAPEAPENSGSSVPDGSYASAITSSWSASSERQLGSSDGVQDDPDHVFPIRSVISVGGSARTSSDHEYFARPQSVSEGSSGAATALGPRTHPSLEKAARRKKPLSVDTQLSGSSCVTPPGPRFPQRRRHPASGSTSSVQADADRYGTIKPIQLDMDDPSDNESDAAAATATPSSRPEGSVSGTKSPVESVPESLYSHRFRHVMTDDGHVVITGRDGTLQRCEDEPIHAPGAVQAFGLMVAVREEADGSLQVRYVSENSYRLIGYSPQDLFRTRNFLDIFSEEQAENLLDHVDFIRDEDADPTVNGPEVFSLSIKPPGARSVKLWCAIHIHASQPDLIVIEFELDDDHEHPLRPADDLTPDVPEDTLQANPTKEELTESTEILSRPLRVLRSARKRRGEAGAMQVFDILSQVQEQLAAAPNLEKFLKILVGIIKELTGFHRVMIYQFDASFSGKVVTELVDPAQTRDLYKGLHFPASDIPKQARDMYKLNKVRLLYDRDLESARIVCRSLEDLETPLDMTHAYLRAMSPIHLKYLANMAVRSSMSISINAFDELWGLIACHSYGQKGMRVSFPIRKMCRLVGDTVSRNIERLSYASRLQARKLINTVPTDKNPSGYIIASSDDLLKLFDADCGMLSIRGETKMLGKIEKSQEALAMLEYLRVRKFTAVLTSQDIAVDFPDLRYPPGFSVIAGLLYVPLSVGGNDFICFFRKCQIREVKWAGNPYEKFIQRGTKAYLEPRKSFKVWNETVVGKCRGWIEEQVETAAVLCLVYGKFIEVWRQKEAALQSSRLTRLLLANSAHEVRTPLNAIINYLEIALEGSLDQETRDNLARSHSASKSLIYVINDLLDLTKTEEGNELVKDEIFEFSACIREATEPFQKDAKRKGIAYEVVEHAGLPRFLIGDQRRVRQAVANMTANAVQHTKRGSVKVELYVTEVMERRVWIEMVVQDTGKGMSNVQVDKLFRDLEQVSTEDDENDDESESQLVQKDLGLGLAVVARIVRNMNGQLRLKSEEGKGSRFVIELPFDLPLDDVDATPGSSIMSGTLSKTPSCAPSVAAAVSKPQEGEVMLVDCGGSAHPVGAACTEMSESDAHSMTSQRSAVSKGSIRSGLSDADRLIDAIQTPLSLGSTEPDSVALQRKNSREHYRGSSVSPTRPEAQPLSPDSLLTASSRDSAQTTGVAYIAGLRTPIKPVKIPDEYSNLTEKPHSSQTSGVLLETQRRLSKAVVEMPRQSLCAGVSSPTRLKVLVAEDDPINMKILRKRLEKAGHQVCHTVNGEDCSSAFEEKSQAFDVVLMDMQMPIVDGLTSTKMIRASERRGRPDGLSAVAARHGHIPIFAVSASLVEREKDTYMDAGFDGWILKPIDFRRLETLLRGIVDDGVRNQAVYKPGRWEQGGWFARRVELPGPAKAAAAAE